MLQYTKLFTSYCLLVFIRENKYEITKDQHDNKKNPKIKLIKMNKYKNPQFMVHILIKIPSTLKPIKNKNIVEDVIIILFI